MNARQLGFDGAVGCVALALALCTGDASAQVPFSAAQPVSDLAGDSFEAGDVDGDGDSDVLMASSAQGTLSWVENIDGDTWTEHPDIVVGLDLVSVARPADFDNDGDLDLLYHDFDTLLLDSHVVWLENLAGDGSAWSERLVLTSFNYQVLAATSRDFDLDGDVDIFSHAGHGGFDEDETLWLENQLDVQGPWTKRFFNGLATLWSPAPLLADLGADGDVDLVFPHVWFEVTGSGVVSHPLVAGIEPSSVVDVDDDGDLDLICSTATSLSWAENTLGNGVAWALRPITSLITGATGRAADMDGDGDPDVLAYTGVGDGSFLMWFENTYGAGVVWTPHILEAANPVTQLLAVDVEGEGDLDAVALGGGPNLRWLENTTWTDRKLGLAGAGGKPHLAGTGPLTAGAPTTLVLSNAAPGSIAALVLGLSNLGAPFKGGTLVPQPDIVVAGLPTGAGELSLGFAWPDPSPSGLPIFLQCWVSDAGGPAGFAASNALLGLTP